MNELVQVAQKVVKAVSGILPFPISLSDDEGYIIGATDSERIGTLHYPSKEILLKRDFISFDKDKVSELDNVLQGIAVPLNFGYETVGVLGIIGPPKEVKPHAELIKQYVEIMWQETYLKQVEDLETKTLEAFLQYTLLNETINKERVEQYCQVLQLNNNTMYVCIVIDIGDSLINSYEDERRSFTVNNLKENLINSAINILANGADDICAFLNLEKIVILKAVRSDEEYFEIMEQFTSKSEQLIHKITSYEITDVFISAGNLCSSLNSISHSFHEAEYLMKYGKESNKNLQVYSYHNWDILLELLPEQIHHTIINKINYRLSPLIAYKGFSELKKVFIVYCEHNLNISEAAKKLFIHRNTLIYRLKKIEELTSLDTRNFQHCTLLYMTLKRNPVLS